jgi:hypothetical protein
VTTYPPGWSPGSMWGRPIRPFALVVSVATVRVTVNLLTGTVTGQTLNGPVGVAFGAIALLSSLLLWAGWWGNRDQWMCEGLLLSCAVWAGVSGVLFYDQGAGSNSAFLAACFSVLAGERWLWARRGDPR